MKEPKVAEENNISHDLEGGWFIRRREGKPSFIHLYNDNLSFSDFPLYFNGKVSYDFPERIPKAVKDKVKELFKTKALKK